MSPEINDSSAGGAVATSKDGMWVGIIVGVLVLVGVGLIVIVKVSKPAQPKGGGFVHYESSLTNSENQKTQELLANF